MPLFRSSADLAGLAVALVSTRAYRQLVDAGLREETAIGVLLDAARDDAEAEARATPARRSDTTR